jgi:hypothetical protein
MDRGTPPTNTVRFSLSGKKAISYGSLFNLVATDLFTPLIDAPCLSNSCAGFLGTAAAPKKKAPADLSEVSSFSNWPSVRGRLRVLSCPTATYGQSVEPSGARVDAVGSKSSACSHFWCFALDCKLHSCSCGESAGVANDEPGLLRPWR